MKQSRLILAGVAMVFALIGIVIFFQSPKPKEPLGFEGGPPQYYKREDLGAGTTLRENFERADKENGR